MASLREELGSRFIYEMHWRRPTIALTSAPVKMLVDLGFNNRQSKYIIEDCAKTQLLRLQTAHCDVFIFDLIRDVRCPLIRSGSTFLFDPSEMYTLVPDALPRTKMTIDMSHVLGAAVTPFNPYNPSFFDVWAEHFDQFYSIVLNPKIAEGCIVIVQEVFLAKHTMPASDILKNTWDYCDAINDLLRRMHSHVVAYPGISRISVEEAQCITANDAPFGGPWMAHPVREVFESLAAQARKIIGSHQRKA